MNLPFTHDQFLEVFAEYNRRLWPLAASLWLVTLGALVHASRSGARGPLAFVLAFHWAWSAVAYHLAFFRQINPAAALFAVVFLAQSALFLWQATRRDGLAFSAPATFRGWVGVLFVVYALAYPLLGTLTNLIFPAMPTFGVPCPTALLTAGLLLMMPGREARPLAAIPALWCGIGGSAAFLLGIRADLALLPAGALLVFHVFLPGPTHVRSRGKRAIPLV